MSEQWRAFASAIARDVEPTTHGDLGRHVVEILLAAEESSITGREVRLRSGGAWTSQLSGSAVTSEDGWIYVRDGAAIANGHTRW